MTTGVSSWNPRTSAAPYLSALLVVPVVYYSGLAVVADAAVGPVPWTLLLLLATAVVAVVCWVRFRAQAEWDGLLRAWFIIGLILWTYVLVAGDLRGASTAGAAAVVPLTLVLVLLKRPGRSDAWAAADALAWTVVGTSVVVLLLEALGLIPSWYFADGVVQSDLLAFDRDTHWLPVNDVLGLDARWGGPLRHPNITGLAGAVLAVYGFARPGARRASFVVTGVLILVLTDSRSSYAAAAMGLCLLAALPVWGRPYLRVSPARVVALVLGVVLGSRVIQNVAENPGLTGRTTVWPEFLSLWPQSPVLGVGEGAIAEAIASGQLPPWSFHGHNFAIDTLVRHGLVGLGLSVLFLGIAFAVTIRGVGRSTGVGLAMLSALVLASFGELVFEWRYPSAAFSALVVAVLLASAPDEPVPDRAAAGSGLG